MTIEINKAKSIYVYRIDPKDTRNIERKENKFRSRWYFYARRDTPQEAKRALMAMAGTESK